MCGLWYLAVCSRSCWVSFLKGGGAGAATKPGSSLGCLLSTWGGSVWLSCVPGAHRIFQGASGMLRGLLFYSGTR